MRFPRSAPVRAATVTALATVLMAAPVALGLAPAAAARPSETGGHRAGTEHAPLALRLARRATPEEVDTPLSVTISQLSPGTLPQRGLVRISGTVTNLDDETWSLINVYAFLGSSPLTTPEQLEEAAATDPELDVGGRITQQGTSDRIDEIPPGDSAQFNVTVPSSLLQRDQDGVYWFGIHALGQNSEGRDNFADGRARTFLPRVTARQAETVPTALVIPLRNPIRYAADGTLTHLPAWAKSLAAGGRLRSLVDLGASAGNRPVSWIVDPALIDAVRQVASGNPPRHVGPTVDGAPPAEEESEEESADARVDPSTRAAAVRAAESWLAKLRRTVEGGGELYTLPYGDVDVDAALDHAPDLLADAAARTSHELDGWNATPRPVVASPDGYLSVAGIAGSPPGATVVVSDELLHPGDQQAETADAEEAGEAPVAPGRVTVDGRRVVVASSGAAAGGPGPNTRQAPLAVRQRILAEAAVRTPTGDPLTVVLPFDWHPESATGFFPLLDQPWMRLSVLSGAASGPTSAVRPDAIHYPERRAEAELGESSFAAAERLITRGEELERLLTYNDRVADVVRGQALTTVSYAARQRPRATEASVAASQRLITGLLGRVRVDAPPRVTLTSSSGTFAAIVHNELGQPVTVALEVTSDRPGMTVRVPPEINVEAAGRSRVLIEAETTESGIHNVGLMLTDSEGVPVGVPDQLNLRSAQVSGIIWIFMAAGGALLFGAIALRLFRRIRAARRGRAA